MTEEGTGPAGAEGTTPAEVPPTDDPRIQEWDAGIRKSAWTGTGTVVQFQIDPDQDPAEVAERVGNVEVEVTLISRVKIYVSELQLVHARVEGSGAVEDVLARAAGSGHGEEILGWRVVGPLGDTIAHYGIQIDLPVTSEE